MSTIIYNHQKVRAIVIVDKVGDFSLKRCLPFFGRDFKKVGLEMKIVGKCFSQQVHLIRGRACECREDEMGCIGV